MSTGFALSQLDTSTPHPARIYDALLGGKNSYPADREAAMKILAAAPQARDSARANRAFLQRAVRYLAGQEGIGQFLDIGTGIPSAGTVHEIAAQAAPGTRVAYVDNDPIVHTYANALLASDQTTSIVLADLRDPGHVLAHPGVTGLIDFNRPVALILAAVVHFLTDAEDPAGIIAAFRDALAPGSFLVLSHATGDFRPGPAREAAAVYDQATSPVTLRTRNEVTALFDGWDLTAPGVVQAPLWRPDRSRPRPQALARAWVYAGAARTTR
jgi:SAM-dependent methyltransferase